jgi:hypothetical protein
MKRLLLTAAAVALASCATLGGASGEKKGGPEKVALINIIPFDIAACSARTLELSPLTGEVLYGALLSLDPAIQECFLDPKTYDGTELKDNALRATVAAAVSFEVLGTGLSPAGKECLMATARKLAIKPLEASAKPVTVDVPVGPASKPVAFGLNNGSDAVGTIRLAQPAFCPCYAELGTRPAPVMELELVLSKTQPAQVTIKPNEVPTISACVLEKVKALQFPAADLTLPYKFLLKNAYATGPTPGIQPELEFQQLEGIRAQKTADVLVNVGRYVSATNTYGDLVTRYKANPKGNIGLIKELRTKCAAVVAADEAQMGSLKAVMEVLDSASKLVQGEKAKNPETDAGKAWAQLEDALSKQQANFKTELARVEGQKKSDEGGCPKNK